MPVSSPSHADGDLAIASIHIAADLQALEALHAQDPVMALELAKAWGEDGNASELRKQAASGWVQKKEEEDKDKPKDGKPDGNAPAKQKAQPGGDGAAKNSPATTAPRKGAVNAAPWAAKLRAAFQANGLTPSLDGGSAAQQAYQQGKVDAHKQHAKRIHHVLARTARDSFQNGMMSKADLDAGLVKAFDASKHPRGHGGEFTAGERAEVHDARARAHTDAFDAVQEAASHHEPDSEIRHTLDTAATGHAMRSIQHVDLAEHFQAVAAGKAKHDPEREAESDHLLASVDADKADHHFPMAEHHLEMGARAEAVHDSDGAHHHFEQADRHLHAVDSDHEDSGEGTTIHVNPWLIPHIRRRRPDETPPKLRYFRALGRGAAEGLGASALTTAGAVAAAKYGHPHLLAPLLAAARVAGPAGYFHGVYSSYKNQSKGFERPSQRAGWAAAGHVMGDLPLPVIGGAYLAHKLGNRAGGKYRPAQKLAPEADLNKAVLTAKARGRLKSRQFAGPHDSYPIEDADHARAALALVSRFGSPAAKKRVRRAVARKFPGIA